MRVKTKSLKEIFLDEMLLSMIVIDGDPPGDPGGGDPGGGGTGGGGGGGTPGGGTVSPLPGLATANLRKRYTSNLAIIDETPLLDVLHECILVSCRGYFTQAANGKIRLHNKKPADYAYGITAFTGNTIEVDNAEPWVASQQYFIVVDPHTDQSEVRQVLSAVFPTSQNSIPLVSDHPSEIVVTGFSGADGASTPATATIDFGAFVASTDYIITINGIDIEFIPGSGDTGESVAATIAGLINGHPKLNRQFKATQVSGNDFITVTARDGTLTLNAALTGTHAAPQADPVTAPTLAAASSGSLQAGEYIVAYSYRNAHGQTLLSNFKAITIAANQKVNVSAISPPAGCSVVWYCSPEANSTKLRYLSENNGAGFTIDWPLPKLSAPLPPDLNRTGTEIIRVCAVFSDRGEVRSNVGASNVLRGTFKWKLGNRREAKNVIELPYREANQDFRLVTLRERDDASIAKIKKKNVDSRNGQAIDNYFQAKRIATCLLAEAQDADFYYQWNSNRRASLIEEGDVVCITDDGSGVVNLPIMVQDIMVNFDRAGLPTVNFTGQKYYSTLYDDAVNDIAVPIVSEL